MWKHVGDFYLKMTHGFIFDHERVIDVSYEGVQCNLQ